jgi:hypothetical protein
MEVDTFPACFDHFSIAFYLQNRDVSCLFMITTRKTVRDFERLVYDRSRFFAGPDFPALQAKRVFESAERFRFWG